MTTGLIITTLVFLVAIALAVAANFAIQKYVGNRVPDWANEFIVIVCILVIMSTLYHSVGYIWGVYELPECIQRILK